MKKLFALLCLFSSAPLFAQDYLPSVERISSHIHTLASDQMKGRGTGSRENDKAAQYITKEFRKLGLLPMGSEGYWQPFTAKVKRVVVTDSLRKAKNVIGFLNNRASHTIVIGAHYDHLGMGRQGSSLEKNPEGKIHNGADDNASGVAGLLELARYYAQNGVKEEYNFLFIAFGAEELGLQGSRHFLANPTVPLDQLNFMVCMDMIGRYNPDRGVGVGGVGTSDTWAKVFEGVEASVKFFTDRAGNGGSDNAAFYAKQIPVLFFHTGGHDDYHKPTDDVEKIDFKSEVGILNLEIKIIDNALKQPKMSFTPVS
ncbi:M20/M25/M40 family metallo-hydrolase [Siphonobacter curvatus]|nr:M20/M25/M40 family metallo-hydrolase [Siphonobacter curvatus]